jgi:hypothetical protein
VVGEDDEDIHGGLLSERLDLRRRSFFTAIVRRRSVPVKRPSL